MSTVVEFYRNNAITIPQSKALIFQSPEFKKHVSWRELWQAAVLIASQLRQNGIREGDQVGILSHSSWRWEAAQLGIFLCRATVVGLDPNDQAESYSFIISQAKLKAIFVGSSTLKNKLMQIFPPDNLLFLDMEFAEGNPESNLTTWPENEMPEPDDRAVIIFTSGTTSQPKGILYSHHQLFLAVEAIMKNISEIPRGSQTICWLPMSNLFQRVVNFCCVSLGGEIYFIESPLDIIANLNKVNPVILIGVPRFYEKIYESVMTKVHQRKFMKYLFFAALAVGMRRSKQLQNHGKVQIVTNLLYQISHFFFLKRIKNIFGNRILFLISGSAPLRHEVIEFFHCCDHLILEAYGTSENVVPIAMNRFHDYRFGTVGKPLAENSVKLSADGEILIRSVGLFSGYLNQDNPEIFIDAYYKTGDLGAFDPDGYLKIQGRKGEVFKTSTGKKVSALEVESQIKKIPYIDTAVTIGENRKAPITLITLNFSALASYMGQTLEKLWDGDQESFDHLVLEKIRWDLLSANFSLSDNNRSIGFIVLTRKFSLEGREITANLKIRRKQIEEKFTQVIDQIYRNSDGHRETQVVFCDEQNSKMGLAPAGQPPSSTFIRLGNIFGFGLEIIWTQLISYYRKESSAVLARKIGKILRLGLGRMRGPLQKLGQMLSYLHEDLPAEFREELSQLLKDSTPVNSSLIREIVESELKAPIPKIFARWEDTPLATASLGQVHFATIADGHAVAVKVLFPGIQKIAQVDLMVLRICSPFLHLLWRNSWIYKHIGELTSLMKLETNLKNEAQNILIFQRLFKDDPRVIIPGLHSSLSTTKVLVTEYIEGRSIDEFCRMASVSEREALAKVIWEYFCISINRFAIFNADPHKGNFLIVGKKLAVFDFGFCKTWDVKFVDTWKKQTLAACQNDYQGFVKYSKEIGYYRENDDSYFEVLFTIHRDVFYRPYLKNEKFRFTHAYVKEFFTTLYGKVISVQGMKVSANMVAVTRLYLESFSIYADLEVEINYHEITIPYFEEATLGHNEQDKSEYNQQFLAI